LTAAFNGRQQYLGQFITVIFQNCTFNIVIIIASAFDKKQDFSVRAQFAFPDVPAVDRKYLHAGGESALQQDRGDFLGFILTRASGCYYSVFIIAHGVSLPEDVKSEQTAGHGFAVPAFFGAVSIHIGPVTLLYIQIISKTTEKTLLGT
jgi:hypothetical protein